MRPAHVMRMCNVHIHVCTDIIRNANYAKKEMTHSACAELAYEVLFDLDGNGCGIQEHSSTFRDTHDTHTYINTDTYVYMDICRHGHMSTWTF